MNEASDRSSEIAGEAARWFGLRDGGLTSAQQQEFQRWMADPAHAAAYDRLNSVWAALDRLPAAAPVPRAGAFPNRRLRASKAFFVSGLLAAAAVAALLVVWQHPTSGSAAAEGHESTAVGQERRVELSDGSVVQLNTNSAVQVQYSAAERRVRLEQGEAHFQVAKNAARPFIVSAAGVTVRAVGTAFDVWVRDDSIRVTVNEGKVRVDEAESVAAGQQALVALAAGVPGTPVVSDLSQTAVGSALAWREDLLKFGPTPLSEVVAQFNRYNRHQLVISDPAIGSLRIGGTFRPEAYEAFVRVLENNFGVRARADGEVTWLEKAR